MMMYTREQFVPIVCKNKDYLVGFLDCVSNIQFEGDGALDLVLTLSSLRFTDYLPSGDRKSEVTKEQITEILTEYRESMRIHEDGTSETEESSDIVEQPLLKLHCTCGNYVEFMVEEEIPKTPYKCDICNKYLIDYTYRDTWEFVYDGADDFSGDEDE